jgi:tetratricopeptide (TPR) repeat protein
MVRKALASEFSYRRKERFQVPLAIGLVALATGLLLPPPPFRRKRPGLAAATAKAAVLFLALLLAGPAKAQAPGPAASATPVPAAPPARKGTVLDEVLLRPRRATAEGRKEYGRGSHPEALKAFERAAEARPDDPSVRFNVADGLYKNGKYDEAAALFRALGEDGRSPLAGAARFNLGNSLFQKQDYKGAVKAYRDALRTAPGDEGTRRNLELALRALKEQEEQQKKQQEQQKQDQKDQNDQKQDPKSQQDQKKGDEQQQGQDQKKQQQQQGQPQPQRPQTPEEKADQRFREETGMPKERAMQLLDALQQNEKAEQKKLLAAKRAQKKKGKDW